MPAKNLISVILPIYNMEKYLDESLSSVQNQSYQNLEIICVNDGSTDSSLDIIRNHAEADPRIVIIDKPNAGYGAGCNAGIAASHGQWIAIVEPDDYILPKMYEKMIDFATKVARKSQLSDSGIDIIKTPYWRIYRPETPQERKLQCAYKHRVKPAQQPFTVADAPVLLRHHPSIWSALYSKAFLDSHQIRFMEIPGAGWADNPFLTETLLNARNIVYLDEAFYCYREDSPERARKFDAEHADVELSRWNDMQDIIDRIQADESPRSIQAKLNLTYYVMRAHTDKAFVYLKGIMAAESHKKEEIIPLIAKTFDRIPPSAVLENPAIGHAEKALYCTYRGIDESLISDEGHRRFLVNMGLYTLRNNGPAYTLELTKRSL